MPAISVVAVKLVTPAPAGDGVLPTHRWQPQGPFCYLAACQQTGFRRLCCGSAALRELDLPKFAVQGGRGPQRLTVVLQSFYTAALQFCAATGL